LAGRSIKIGLFENTIFLDERLISPLMDGTENFFKLKFSIGDLSAHR